MKKAQAVYNAWFDGKPIQVAYAGDSFCTTTNQCSVGVGDCDTDNDCMSGLKCGQRDKGETFPGLTGFEKFPGNVAGDYCFDPKWNQKVASMKKNSLV